MHVHSLAYSAPLPLPFEKEKEGDRANTERWFVFARRLPLLLLLLAVWLKRKAITELQQRRRRCLGTVSLSFSVCVPRSDAMYLMFELRVCVRMFARLYLWFERTLVGIPYTCGHTHSHRHAYSHTCIKRKQQQCDLTCWRIMKR